MLTRRRFAGLAAAAPLAGMALGRGVEGGPTATQANQAGMFRGLNDPNAFANQAGKYADVMKPPKMGRCEALRIALADPDMKRLITSWAFKQNQRVTEIDPDIQCLRALSPMAKITFQRQRNVERYLGNLVDEDANQLGFGGVVGAFIKKLMWD